MAFVMGGSARKAVKKANLYTWLSLQTLPEVSKTGELTVEHNGRFARVSA